MRQSIGLIILQFVSIVLGLISVFWVAGSLPAEVFAIIGVYEIITSFVKVFSNTGIETYAIRNVLVWKSEGLDEKIKEVVTQSLVLRILGASILVIPVSGYIYFISVEKFEGQYIGLFIVMAVFSIFGALNDSVILILRSFNKYFSAALVTYSVNIFGRLLALYLFVKFGFQAYVGTIIILPLLITIPVLIKLKDYYCFRGVFSKELVLRSLKKSKHFTFSSYVSYVFSFLDQLVVSIVFPAEILGSFSIGKRLVLIAKTFIENIFDPMIQGLVKWKNNTELLGLKLKKIQTIKNILLGTALLILPIVIYFTDDFLVLFNLNNYPYLDWFLVVIYISHVVLIELKIKYNFISIFYDSSYYLKLSLLSAGTSILFFVLILLFLEVKFVFFYLGLMYVLMILYTNYVYKRGGLITKNICK